jgi:hypothetical protein
LQRTFYLYPSGVKFDTFQEFRESTCALLYLELSYGFIIIIIIIIIIICFSQLVLNQWYLHNVLI